MSKPFIQLFKTPRNFYFYDVNMNEILPISEESFLYLQDCIQNDKAVNENIPTELQELKQDGYLNSTSVVEEIRHAYSEPLDVFLDRKLQKITLQVTQSCNLRCKYCIYSESANPLQRSHSNRKMNWEVAKRAIDFFYEHSIDSEHINIGFYGGEPLLEMALIKQVVEYSKELFNGKALSFTTTTNGTLITEEIIDYLASEDIQLMISLDGPKEIHDKSRVFVDGTGTFDKVMQNLEMIKRRVPEYAKKISFSMVMDPSNDFDCINEINFSAQDLSSHTFSASVVDNDYSDIDTVYSEEYLWKIIYHEFLSLLSIFHGYPEEKVSVISKSSAATLANDVKRQLSSGRLHKVAAPSGPCIPGQLRLFVNVNGEFFPCERVSENSEVMCIGSLDNGFDVEKARRVLNVAEITKEECKNCWCFQHCNQCAKKADDGSGQFSAVRRLKSCQSSRASAYAKIRNIILKNEVDTFYAGKPEI